MYRYLDRPVGDLAPAQRFLVTAMRTWVGEMAQRRCPWRRLGPFFVRHDVVDGMPRFEAMMAALNSYGARPILFGARGTPTVVEDEAILIALVDDTTGANDMRCCVVAQALVQPRCVFSFLNAIGELRDLLACSAILSPPDAVKEGD